MEPERRHPAGERREEREQSGKRRHGVAPGLGSRTRMRPGLIRVSGGLERIVRISVGRPGPTVPAQTEQLEPMSVDPEPASALDIPDGPAEPRVIDLRRPAAARAHDVVVMDGGTWDVRMLAGREVEARDDPELDQELQRP